MWRDVNLTATGRRRVMITRSANCYRIINQSGGGKPTFTDGSRGRVFNCVKLVEREKKSRQESSGGE